MRQVEKDLTKVQVKVDGSKLREIASNYVTTFLKIIEQLLSGTCNIYINHFFDIINR